MTRGRSRHQPAHGEGDAAKAINHLLDQMSRAFEDAQVTGHGPLIDSMRNHPKDRHVLAAAVRARADAIVTYNLADFPVDVLKPLEIEAFHPDEFLLNQLDLHPLRARQALETNVARNRRPPQSLEQLAASLERSGLPRFAAQLRPTPLPPALFSGVQPGAWTPVDRWGTWE